MSDDPAIRATAQRFLKKREGRRAYLVAQHEHNLLSALHEIADLERQIAAMEHAIIRHRERLTVLDDEVRAWRLAIMTLEIEP